MTTKSENPIPAAITLWMFLWLIGMCGCAAPDAAVTTGPTLFWDYPVSSRPSLTLRDSGPTPVLPPDARLSASTATLFDRGTGRLLGWLERRESRAGGEYYVRYASKNASPQAFSTVQDAVRPGETLVWSHQPNPATPVGSNQ